MTLVLGTSVRARRGVEAPAKAAQAPVAKLISVPFQDNINFNIGPHENALNVPNFKPQAFYNLE